MTRAPDPDTRARIPESASIMRRLLHHIEAGSTDSAADVMLVETRSYLDPDQAERERRLIFGKVPLLAAFSCELPHAGDLCARNICEVPLLLVRGEDNCPRAFLNSCSHRGAALASEGCSTRHRLTCPYHGWSFGLDGRLLAVADASTFGAVDKTKLDLVEFPCTERAGMIFVSLDRQADVDLEAFLGPLADDLDELGLDRCQLVDQRHLEGPNWKIAREGYLEGYHFRTLHRDSVAKRIIGNLAAVDEYRDHARMIFAKRELAQTMDREQSGADASDLVSRTWLLFPNVAIVERPGGAIVSQIWPDQDPRRSKTTQYFLFHQGIAEGAAVKEIVEALHAAVRDEDYPILWTIQNALGYGSLRHFAIGRNEPLVQAFHQSLATWTVQPAAAE